MDRILDFLNPTRWAILGAVLLALLGGVWGIYETGKTAGADEVRAAWDKSKQQAQDKQDTQVEKSAEAYVETVEVIKTVYRDRIKEVKVYVPTGTCPADPDFVRVFNGGQ